ncbi:MAG: hypothetical protein C5B60_02035 [Chloroflexi bacterium]|nr:MAG: hypothetical protein C5B60_02035 [Chloroflexota bacterium]
MSQVREPRFKRKLLDNGELGPPIPWDDGDYTHGLYVWMQDYKEELRLKFLEDIKRMITEKASTDQLMARLIKHERARRTMREGYDEVGNNVHKHDFDILMEMCDEYGIAEFKEQLLYVRSNLTA